ncbi:hypothetical protein BN871_II_00150 [Paenibacillus sp. P22]|nr:hypothetical protein BN871_II_00150 [Paenibacillus sp. P22]
MLHSRKPFENARHRQPEGTLLVESGGSLHRYDEGCGEQALQGRIPSVEGRPAVFEHGYPSAHLVHEAEVDVGHEEGLLLPAFHKDLTPWIDHHRMAEEDVFAARSCPVAGDHIHLVLDRACRQKRSPVMQARMRPFGRHEQHLGARQGKLARQLGEADIVADHHAGLLILEREQSRLASCGQMLFFLHQAEKMDFRIGAGLLAVAAERVDRVVDFFASLLGDRAGDDMDARASAEIRDQLACPGSAWIGQFLNLLKGVACIPHFRQHEHIRLRTQLRSLAQSLFDETVIGFGITGMHGNLQKGDAKFGRRFLHGLVPPDAAGPPQIVFSMILPHGSLSSWTA